MSHPLTPRLPFRKRVFKGSLCWNEVALGESLSKFNPLLKALIKLVFLHCEWTQPSRGRLQQAATSSGVYPLFKVRRKDTGRLSAVYDTDMPNTGFYEDFATAVNVHQLVWGWRHIDNTTLPCNADCKTGLFFFWCEGWGCSVDNSLHLQIFTMPSAMLTHLSRPAQLMK